MGRSLARTLLGLACIAVLALPAAAAETPPSVKYRQAVMKAQGGHMSGLNALLKHQVDHPSHTKGHVDGIVATAAMTADVFPAGSDQGETDVLPAVWNEPEKFSRAVDDLEAATAKLAAAARSNDEAALRDAFGDVGKACKGCHDHFRKKK